MSLAMPIPPAMERIILFVKRISTETGSLMPLMRTNRMTSLSVNRSPEI